MIKHRISNIKHPTSSMKYRTSIVILSALFIIFVGSVMKFFMLEFETGDVYPAYSSLRSDPLGTRGFYESLENLENLSLTRNFRPLSKIHSGQGTTIFCLGMNVNEMMPMSEKAVETFERLAFSGGRLIFSFLPVKEEKSPETRAIHVLPLVKRWGLFAGRIEYDWKIGRIKDAERILPEKKLPPYVLWRTALFFDSPVAPWKTIYERDNFSVMTEMAFGKGSIVFSSDSYFFSNEALKKENHPELFAWLIGENTRLIFDESHLGIQEKIGIVGLFRRYHLHGFFLGIAVLTGLFVWKHSERFVPYEDQALTEGHGFTSGKNYTEGLVSLLRQNIPQRDILGVCIREWEKSGKKIPNDKLERIRALSDADTVKGYQAISKILSEEPGK